MTIHKEIDSNKPLTAKQKKILEALKTRVVQPDEDCPELTVEQFNQMAKITKIHKEKRKKQTVTLRSSPQTLKKAKSLGKGYTSVLSRILENALDDFEIIKRNL